MEKKIIKTTETGALQKPEIVGDNSTRKGEAISEIREVGNMANQPGTSGTSNKGETGVKSRLVPPSKQRYRARRKAFRILDRVAEIPKGQLTSQQRESVAWARATVNRDDNSEKDPNPKRVRSLDEEEGDDSKRAKVQTGDKVEVVKIKRPPKPFSVVLREQVLVLAVVDKSQDDGSITPGKWGLVYNALNSVFAKVLGENPGPPPSCRDVGWFQGRVKLTACSDKRSADLYKKAVLEVGEVWPGARLEAVGREEIPCRPRARVWLPIEPASPEKTLGIIRLSNPDLPTGNWKIIKREETKGNYRLATIVVNNESLAPLAEVEGVINFGFGSITLKIYRKDGAAKEPVEQTERGPGTSNAMVEGGQVHQPTEPGEMDLIQSMGNLCYQDSDVDNLLDLEVEGESSSGEEEREALRGKEVDAGDLQAFNPQK